MERRQILIVDDYPGARYLRSRILSEAGYEVIEASTGAEALTIARNVRPSLILLDVNLPDISGFEVCERLKQDPATASIPVIQITVRGCRRKHDDREWPVGRTPTSSNRSMDVTCCATSSC
jgi:CheY-like chemotaxis protein